VCDARQHCLFDASGGAFVRVSKDQSCHDHFTSYCCNRNKKKSIYTYIISVTILDQTNSLTHTSATSPGSCYRAIVRYVGCAYGERQSIVKRNIHPVSSSTDEESDADVENHMQPVSLSNDKETNADVERLKNTLFQKRTILLLR